jgi:spore coat polysaccharide biosynthesis predicted glycosyltransferase SpsG
MKALPNDPVPPVTRIEDPSRIDTTDLQRVATSSDCGRLERQPVYQDIESMSAKPMRVRVRADAGVVEGSGHVMRSLTLARELVTQGHSVELAITVEGIPWLEQLVEASGLPVLPVVPQSLDAGQLLAGDPDWVVVDSYLLDAGGLTAVARATSLLAIVDGDTRGISARLFLDQNLGAERRTWALPPGARLLAGSEYALVRPEIVAGRRPEPWRIAGAPRIVAFMGGTDATGAIMRVAQQIAGMGRDVSATVVAAEEHRPAVENQLAGVAHARVLPPGPGLADLLAEADIVVSASGTSAWEIGTLGLPAVLLAVVGNQQPSLAEAVRRGLTLGVDLVVEGDAGFASIGAGLARLCDDTELRRHLSETCTAHFDGRGAQRVVAAMTAMAG